MAPVSAAERQRKRREKLKATGKYDDYKEKIQLTLERAVSKKQKNLKIS